MARTHKKCSVWTYYCNPDRVQKICKRKNPGGRKKFFTQMQYFVRLWVGEGLTIRSICNPAALDSEGYLALEDKSSRKKFKIYILDKNGERRRDTTDKVVSGFELVILDATFMPSHYSLYCEDGVKTISPDYLPIAMENAAGAVKAVAKTEDMTQPVGVDAEGWLFVTDNTQELKDYIDQQLGVIENGAY